MAKKITNCWHRRKIPRQNNKFDRNINGDGRGIGVEFKMTVIGKWETNECYYFKNGN